jgi:aminoglycoside N3'-acetyltransferase
MDIKYGDTVFIMYTAKRIHKRCGRKIDANLVLDSILKKIGSEGTLVALCFSKDRNKILNKTLKYNVNKTPTMSGVLSELLRKRKAAKRSLNPIFSAVAFGKHADYLTNGHELDPYAFSSKSPYYKLVELNAKYLGLGLGFDAFTPMHILDDHYKEDYIHKLYNENEESFNIVDQNGNPLIVKSKTRTNFKSEHLQDIVTYLKKLKITYRQTMTPFGFHLFSMNVKDFYNSAIEKYEDNGLTLWTTGSSNFRRWLNYKKIWLRDYL